MDPDDQTASLMTPAKLAQVSAARAPVSPSAFLDQMAADVGHQQVRRLGELRSLLEDEARASSAAAVRPAIGQLAQALSGIDFGLLEPRGWWAGLTGKRRSVGAEFAATYELVETYAQTLATGVASAQKAQQPHAVAADRVLVEFEVETQALGKLIDQGARWLQTMRGELKDRLAKAPADPQVLQSVAQDESRCEILVGRLKALRAAVAVSQQVHQEALVTAQRRSALTTSTLQALASEVKAWRASLSALASSAAHGAPLEGLGEARAVHDRLQRRLAEVLVDCEQLATHEAALVEALAEMGERLRPLA